MKKHVLVNTESRLILLVSKSVINWLRMHDMFTDDDGDEFFVVNKVTYCYNGKFKVNSI